MARIVGVELPKEKRMDVALRSIYGIGPTRAAEILGRTQIDPAIRSKDLSEADASKLTSFIQSEYRVEGELRREVTGNIKRLMEISCYRGNRHKRSLPVRGQRSHTNARTRKGPRRAVGGRKK
ncbi:MAG: 30S ribosomal protein S13 [Candidatus Omnitrophica bacterium]|nr:30S ribosomal protein S13 [Candidatus Omnitrophota bacterium]